MEMAPTTPQPQHPLTPQQPQQVQQPQQQAQPMMMGGMPMMAQGGDMPIMMVQFMNPDGR